MLVSPGQQITISDESQYVPGAVGSVPLVILATEQDKLSQSGTLASGTIAANAGKLQVFTSQRDIASALGLPDFKLSAAGTPLHGDERNEYGLLAAYSSLGIANKVYAIRADIDTSQLAATSIRPAGNVPTGTNWLDTVSTDFGVTEWNATRSEFVKVKPRHIDSEVVNIDGVNFPLSSVGEIGSYAVVLGAATASFNSSAWNLFYKNKGNNWVLVGSNGWTASHPTVKSTLANPVVVVNGQPQSFTINGTEILVTDGTSPASLSAVVSAINSADIDGVTASEVDGRLEIYSSISSLTLSNLVGSPLALLGINTGEYAKPVVEFGTYVQIPNWRSTDLTPRPSGSVYVKTSAIGNGANFSIKKYNALSDTWVAQAAPLYANVSEATKNLDLNGGGINIAAGSIFVKYDVSENNTVSFKPYTKFSSGATKITAGLVGNSPFTSGTSFTVTVTSPGKQQTTVYTATLTGTNRAAFVAAILAANIPEVTAQVEASSAISLTHKHGGAIVISGAVAAQAGFSSNIPGVQETASGSLELSAWVPLTYTYSDTEPTQNPADGTLWYYGSAAEVDILVNTLDGWKGYQNESSDARGYDLRNTDPTGVIVSASKPTTQSDSSALVAGDIWLDTSDLENWPALSRYNGSVWVKIDNTDQVSQNGIIFADARWAADEFTNPINGDFPAIAGVNGLVKSNYLDADAPDARLFPRGTLLFNTRRSGYNVKRFVNNYFNENSFPDIELPAVRDAWVSASGLKNNGAMYAGRQAQRQMVVSALKAAIDGSTEIREEQFQFNLITAPGYPELIPNMVALNNDRANTAFVIGDTPMRLQPNGIDLANWSNNSDNATGLATNDPYLGVYYPGCALTNDVQGNSVVVPASHVALRTFIHNDNISYQWFAPAGTRRGLVDNATSVGFISPVTGEYTPIGVNQGLRDTLSEQKINPITNLPGVGLVVWGQKTRNPVASSMDRINVARLVNYIRTILSTIGNGFLFEPNDKITRDQLKTIISGAINDLVSKRGIYDYLVVCDDSNNTPTRIARNELYVDIAIEPMKGVEFIYIPIRLYNPGDVSGLGK